MIELTDYANNKLFQTLSNYIHISRPYDKPPIYYWYRRIINALISFEGDAEINGGHHKGSLPYNLGDVYYFVTSIIDQQVIVVKDFDFNIGTLRSILFPKSIKTTNRPSLPIFNSPASKIIKSRNIGYKIVCSEYADGSIRLTWKGKGNPLNTQFDRLLKPFVRRRDGIYAIGEKDGVQYKLFANDTVQPITEQRNKKVVRLTESQLQKIINETISDYLNESYVKRQSGQFTVVKGDNEAHSIKGLEMFKDNLYDVAMYDSPNSTFCVYSIGKHTNKFVCCKLLYDKEYGTWLGFEPIKSQDVPILIKKDLKRYFINS